MFENVTYLPRILGLDSARQKQARLRGAAPGGPRAPHQRLPAAALGRRAAARGDRARADQRARDPDRRRADRQSRPRPRRGRSCALFLEVHLPRHDGAPRHPRPRHSSSASGSASSPSARARLARRPPTRLGSRPRTPRIPSARRSRRSDLEHARRRSMTLLQALRLLRCARPWWASRGACACACWRSSPSRVSLFLAGVFLLVSRNLESTVRRWRDEARLVVYLEAAAGEEADAAAVEARLRSAAWASEVDEGARAPRRQRALRALLPEPRRRRRAAVRTPLPASLEARAQDAGSGRGGAVPRLARRASRRSTGVELVDDDRDWIGQVETAARAWSAASGSR